MAVDFVICSDLGSRVGFSYRASDASSTRSSAGPAMPSEARRSIVDWPIKLSSTPRCVEDCSAIASRQRLPRGRAATRARVVRVAAWILGAVCCGAVVAQAATAIALTVAVTGCVVFALLAFRAAVGPRRLNEIASWIALAASIAGLVFSVATAGDGHGRRRPVCLVRLVEVAEPKPPSEAAANAGVVLIKRGCLEWVAFADSLRRSPAHFG
jgi:hypothetical protein